MDLGDKHCHLYVLDNATVEELERTRVPTSKMAIRRWFGAREAARVVIEVGGHSGWVSRLIAQLGHDVLIADPRRARKLMGDEEKDDDLDAELLARFGRADPKLLKPVTLRSEETQCALAVVRSRDALVGARTQLVNHVRGMVKAVGQRLPSCSTDRFAGLRDEIPEQLTEALDPTMLAIESLTEQIRHLDRVVNRMCEQDYPDAGSLQQISGVGPISALTYVLTIEDPSRFEKSRQVGPYLGLCRRRWRSGEGDPELHISKAGDAMLRRLLVQCAHYILGPFGPDSDLRRWGLAYAEKGGRAAKKRAAIGVARRLAVLMHRLWTSGETYVPLYNAKENNAA
jgi:transposase